MFGVFNNARQTLLHRVQAMRSHMDAVQRCKLAEEISEVYDRDQLSAAEREIAEEIITRLVEDEVEQVRIAIAEGVASSPYLPVELASKLAKDIREVSIPVLELSPVLEDRLLEEIVKSGLPEKIQAIAGRNGVSEELCRQIVASGRKGAVVRMLKNETAQITDHTMVTVIRVYGDDEGVEQAVFERGQLSEDVLATLRELSEDHVATFIRHYFDLSEQFVDSTMGRNLLDRSESSAGMRNWWDREQGVV